VASVAQTERARLADLLAEVGPDAPTLCEGWTAADLAAHVVLRERRPDAALGIRVPLLAGHTRAVQQGLAGGSWSELVDKVRHRSRLLVDRTDDLFNTTELFVHHEDVRRAAPDWQPRPTDAHLEATMWRALRRSGRLFFRKVPVGIELQIPDGRRHVVRPGPPTAVLTGTATELVMYAHGRTSHALVELSGDPAAVRRLRSTQLDI
jgi:uncharacterized protein (TIGR03085 family)